MSPVAERADALVHVELVAGVGDVEVAHRQLTDPVERTERLVLHAFHRQTDRVRR